MTESLKQGGSPAAFEAAFDVSKIKIETRLWYGGAVKRVPAPIGEWLVDRIPNSVFTCRPEPGISPGMASDNAAEAICPDQRYNPSN